ncbi:Embryogenesis-associated protein [Trichinella spiralis]|uniref:Embryogenesis-associated protein n=2 Tax=Trichinella spiralis TaxID=6334 RepID=A0ABR3L2A4_TRISP|nr:hypothetical protein T01_1424 [Trichinella spiralis]
MFGKLASLGGYVLLLVNVTRGRPWTDLIQSAKVNVIVKNNQGQPGPLQGCRLLDVIVGQEKERDRKFEIKKPLHRSVARQRQLVSLN